MTVLFVISFLLTAISGVVWFVRHTGKYWTGEEQARDQVDVYFWICVISVVMTFFSLWKIMT